MGQAPADEGLARKSGYGPARVNPSQPALALVLGLQHGRVRVAEQVLQPPDGIVPVWVPGDLAVDVAGHGQAQGGGKPQFVAVMPERFIQRLQDPLGNDAGSGLVHVT
jgi:hypothetical protein